VSAALILGRPKDKEAVAAFELGLRSTKQGWIREICEDELDKLGKLRLPLPEDVYTAISEEEYERFKERPSWRERVEREIKKGDTIYLEVVTQPAHAPAFRDWFKVKLEPAGASAKRKTIAKERKEKSLALKGPRRTRALPGP